MSADQVTLISLVVASTVLVYVAMAVSARREEGGPILPLILLQALIFAAGAGVNWLWSWVGTVAIALLYLVYLAIVYYDLAIRK